MSETGTAAIAAAVAAERERIRLGILGCTTCGKIHEYRQKACSCGKGAPTWADPDDGHAYSPALRGGDPDGLVRRVTGG